MKKIKTKKDYESYRKALLEHIEELLEETHANLHLIVHATSLDRASFVAAETIKKFPFKRKKEEKKTQETYEPPPLKIYDGTSYVCVEDPATGAISIISVSLPPEDEKLL